MTMLGVGGMGGWLRCDGGGSGNATVRRGRHGAGGEGARGAAAERRRLTTAWRGSLRWTGGRMESLCDAVL